MRGLPLDIDSNILWLFLDNGLSWATPLIY